MEPKVILDNDFFVAVNKPSGLLTHPDGKSKDSSLTEWLSEKYPETEGVGEKVETSSAKSFGRFGLLHRIDRETSGLVLIAKNERFYSEMKEEFLSHRVVKKYMAFVYGKVAKESGVIESLIKRSRSDFRKKVSVKAGTSLSGRGKGREALTEYKVVFAGKDFSVVEARPITGRTHQIRVHLSSVNHPILCDRLYAPKRECGLGFERLALHSRSLKFETTTTGEVKIEAPYPEDFLEAGQAVGFDFSS